MAPRLTPDGRPDGLLRLATRIGRNLAVSDLRRRRLDPVGIESLQDEDEPARDWAQPDPHLRAILARCRDQLPARPAAALAARLENAGGAPDRTLAQRLGMRHNTFLQNITRARRLLAACLERHGVDLDLELS